MEIEGHTQYLIYPDGRVFSKKKNIFLSDKFLSQGYHRVSIQQTKYRVHRLLAQHYIPNPDNLPMVDHINRDRLDNRLENLRWVSHAENNDNKSVKKSAKTGIRGLSHLPSRGSPKKWRFSRRSESFYAETKAIALWIKFYFHINKW